jgi:hypothetical protein
MAHRNFENRSIGASLHENNCGKKKQKYSNGLHRPHYWVMKTKKIVLDYLKMLGHFGSP